MSDNSTKDEDLKIKSKINGVAREEMQPIKDVNIWKKLITMN